MMTTSYIIEPVALPGKHAVAIDPKSKRFLAARICSESMRHRTSTRLSYFDGRLIRDEPVKQSRDAQSEWDLLSQHNPDDDL